jgi:hypothetical protein
MSRNPLTANLPAAGRERIRRLAERKGRKDLSLNNLPLRFSAPSLRTLRLKKTFKITGCLIWMALAQNDK